MKNDRRIKAQSICKKIIREFFIENLEEQAQLTHGIITVTDVEIASELSYLDIYVSSLKEAATLPKTLSPYAENIERLLAKKIDFLKIPKVRFRYDNSGQESFQIYSAIKEISKHESKSEHSQETQDEESSS